MEKSDPPEQQEAAALKIRFDSVKNRAKFARDFSVPGGDSMIYQHIKGLRPMNLDHATAYATGFKCSLMEISPRLARQVASAGGTVPQSGPRALGPAVKAGESVSAYNFDNALEQAVLMLGKAMLSAHPIARRQAEPIFEELARNPDQAAALARQLVSTLNAAADNFAPQALPGNGTKRQ